MSNLIMSNPMRGHVSGLHLEQSFKDLPRFLVLLVLWPISESLDPELCLN